MQAETQEKLSAAEAVMGFAAWLSTREQVTKFGSSEDCAPLVARVREFCETNDLGEPADDYTDRLKHPVPTQEKTSDEWLATDEFAGVQVMDPDGWDRQNFQESWAEKITHDEFMRRLCRSTVLEDRRPTQENG